jgi:hypothetical protein
MSFTQETVELPPDPLLLIVDFDVSHRSMIRVAEEACAEPSNEKLLAVAELIERMGTKIDPLVAAQFFHESGDDNIVRSAVGAVTIAGTELCQRIVDLYPGIGEFRGFVPDAQEPIVETFLTGDVTSMGAPVDEDEALPTLEQASDYVGGIYKELLGHFEKAVMNHDKVVNFLLEQIDAGEKRQDRIEQTKLYFGVALASFAGTIIANYFRDK